MRTSLDPSSLNAYVGRQLETFFPDGARHDLSHVVRRALERLEACFARTRLRGYRDDGGQVTFSHLHSDQYATFLYLASNVAFREAEDRPLAAKLYGLNKALNGLMCMYDTELPTQFLLIHTVGMMLGKATYGDRLVASQAVTVGSDRGVAPRLGEGAVLLGAAVLGDCTLGNNVSVAARSVVRNASIPADHVVTGTSPALSLKPAKRRLIDVYFDPPA